MKKHYKSCLFVITLLTALYLTACSTATDADTHTAETDNSVSDTLIGTANSTSKITEGEKKHYANTAVICLKNHRQMNFFML